MRLNVLVASLQLLPRHAVPARPGRPHLLRNLPDQLIGQLPDAGVPVQPGANRSFHIPAGSLTVHSSLLNHPPQASA